MCVSSPNEKDPELFQNPRSLQTSQLPCLIQLKAGAIFTLLGCIDLQRAAAYFLAVELLDSVRAFFARRHFDEAEAARATCFAIFNQGYAFDRARLCEQCL